MLFLRDLTGNRLVGGRVRCDNANRACRDAVRAMRRFRDHQLRVIASVVVALSLFGSGLPVQAAGVVNPTSPPLVSHSLLDGPSVIFVHGIWSKTDHGFNELWGPLVTEYGERAKNFTHYQDMDFKNPTTGECSGVQDPAPSPDPSGGMPPADPSYIGTNRCRSDGDLALNVVLLHALIQERYEDSEGQPVILISNSMGSAIVRGVFTYSYELDDGVAAMIDSVFYLQGAHDGSDGFRVATGAAMVFCMQPNYWVSQGD